MPTFVQMNIPASMEKDILAILSGEKVAVSKKPSIGVLMSMAMRQNHALGCPGYFDLMPMMSGGVSHARHLEVALSDAGKLYEEVVGTGFHSPEKDAGYESIARQSLPEETFKDIVETIDENYAWLEKNAREEAAAHSDADEVTTAETTQSEPVESPGVNTETPPAPGFVAITPELADEISESIKSRMEEIETRFPELVGKCEYETRLAVTAHVMQNIVAHAKEGGSFRYLIYNRLGFEPDAYLPLYEAGGMVISNEFTLREDD